MAAKKYQPPSHHSAVVGIPQQAIHKVLIKILLQVTLILQEQSFLREELNMLIYSQFSVVVSSKQAVEFILEVFSFATWKALFCEFETLALGVKLKIYGLFKYQLLSLK